MELKCLFLTVYPTARAGEQYEHSPRLRQPELSGRCVGNAPPLLLRCHGWLIVLCGHSARIRKRSTETGFLCSTTCVSNSESLVGYAAPQVVAVSFRATR